MRAATKRLRSRITEAWTGPASAGRAVRLTVRCEHGHIHDMNLFAPALAAAVVKNVLAANLICDICLRSRPVPAGGEAADHG